MLARYCDFFSGCGGVLGGVLPEEPLPLALPEVEPLAPPEAEPEPDFEGSFEGSLAGSLALDELDDEEGELGGVAELPPEGELDEVEPDVDDGGVDDGDEELLLLPLVPLAPLPALLPPLSWPQAARPRAMATATANVESFIGSSMVGYTKEGSKERAGRKPLNSQGQGPARCRHFLLPGTSYLLPGAVDFLDESGWLLALPPGALLALPLEPDGLELLVPLAPLEAPPPAP